MQTVHNVITTFATHSLSRCTFYVNSRPAYRKVCTKKVYGNKTEGSGEGFFQHLIFPEARQEYWCSTQWPADQIHKWTDCRSGGLHSMLNSKPFFYAPVTTEMAALEYWLPYLSLSQISHFPFPPPTFQNEKEKCWEFLKVLHDPFSLLDISNSGGAKEVGEEKAFKVSLHFSFPPSRLEVERENRDLRWVTTPPYVEAQIPVYLREVLEWKTFICFWNKNLKAMVHFCGPMAPIEKKLLIGTVKSHCEIILRCS